jgi:hypothetical protein
VVQLFIIFVKISLSKTFPSFEIINYRADDGNTLPIFAQHEIHKIFHHTFKTMKVEANKVSQSQSEKMHYLREYKWLFLTTSFFHGKLSSHRINKRSCQQQ